jgi:hypothetical protein
MLNRMTRTLVNEIDELKFCSIKELNSLKGMFGNGVSCTGAAETIGIKNSSVNMPNTAWRLWNAVNNLLNPLKNQILSYIITKFNELHIRCLLSLSLAPCVMLIGGYFFPTFALLLLLLLLLITIRIL